ncbi:MAG: DUF4254 domain-containing protein [Candidatus Taylorbacteria bacterium]|nr:DUF4254 domain-containing protein [Candidatus Taylorbacteria bacterium]
MHNIKTISKIFSDVLDGISADFESGDQLSRLIRLNMETNLKLWDLEDSARMTELGSDHVARAKQEIDKNNQIRNDLIREMDTEIAKQINISSGNQEQFYSESPGMIIDRLSILFIKLAVIRGLLLVIKENDLQEEYKEKENIILKQIDQIGKFLDAYFARLERKEVFFEVQQAVKIYNDERVRKHIKTLKKGNKFAGGVK